jgi:hypothetical protein
VSDAPVINILGNLHGKVESLGFEAEFPVEKNSTGIN